VLDGQAVGGGGLLLAVGKNLDEGVIARFRYRSGGVLSAVLAPSTDHMVEILDSGLIAGGRLSSGGFGL
jgi:hypothetical protein